MRPAHVLRVLLLFALVAAVGCESENRGKVEGKRWRSGAATVKGQPVPDGAMMIDFRQNGKLVFRAGNQFIDGSYRLGFGRTIHITLDRPIAGRRQHDETIEVRGDRLTMTDSDGTSLTFYEDR